MGPGFLGIWGLRPCPHAGADSLWWGQTLAVSGPATTPPLAVGAPTGATLFPQLRWMHQDVWSQIFICLGSPSIHLWLSRGLLFTHTYTAKLYICLCTPPLLCLFGAVYYLSVLCYRSSSWRPSVSVYFTLDFYFHSHSFPLFFPISLLSYLESGLYALSASAKIST